MIFMAKLQMCNLVLVIVSYPIVISFSGNLSFAWMATIFTLILIQSQIANLVFILIGAYNNRIVDLEFGSS